MTHNYLPEGWQWTALGDALSLVSRSESVDPDSMYQLGGVRWYAAGVHVHDTVHGDEIKTPVLSRVISGDVMYNKMWASKGSFGIAHEQHSGIYVTNEYPQFAVNSEVLRA